MIDLTWLHFTHVDIGQLVVCDVEKIKDGCT